MQEKPRYTCPVHDDVILFTDPPSTSSKRLTEGLELIMIREKPQECPKCRKFYYKAECKVRP